MRSLGRVLVRISSFLRKEIYEILRQPRLIVTLVIGPFMILLLFGVGYRAEARPLRTIFVVEDGSPLIAKIEEFASSLGPQLIYEGITSNEAEALQLLSRRRIDVVAVAPSKPYETIRNNEQAIFTLYHNEIDPFQADYVSYFGRIYIDEVNRRVLQTITEEGQGRAATTESDVAAARESASALRAALEQGDAAAARRHHRELDSDLDRVETRVDTTTNRLDSVQQTFGNDGNSESKELRDNLSRIREETTEMENLDEGRSSYSREAERAAKIEEDLAELETQLEEVQQIDSRVLVSPFRSQTQGIAPLQPQLADYFAPSVLVLLLQHLAVTFAALSLVREQQLGTVELFRVSPITAGETLAGKYLSYLIFGGVLAALLTTLLIYLLSVPMLGLWANFALVIAILLFTSLGFGFVISLIVDTDSQAVQYAMLILLGSVFFSGFFLSLQTLWEPVRVLSWLLPATYGIHLLQDIMLRGTSGDPLLLAGLAGIGAVLYLIAWFLLRRRIQLI